MNEQKVLITNSEVEINNLINDGWKIISITAQLISANANGNFCVLLQKNKTPTQLEPKQLEEQLRVEQLAERLRVQRLEEQLRVQRFKAEFDEADGSVSLKYKDNQMIIKAIKKHYGNRKNAAKELGISERTLYRKLKELCIKI
jgi:transcriptional regulator of acetoin/glycerol metabolism